MDEYMDGWMYKSIHSCGILTSFYLPAVCTVRTAKPFVLEVMCVRIACMPLDWNGAHPPRLIGTTVTVVIIVVAILFPLNVCIDAEDLIGMCWENAKITPVR